MKRPVIRFDKSAQKETLEMLGIYPNADGWLIKDGNYIYAFDDGNPIHELEFGGIWKGKNGQIIYFKSDLPSLIATLDKINKEKDSEGVV